MEQTQGLSRRQMLGATAGTVVTATAASGLLPGAAAAGSRGRRGSREHLVPQQNIGIQMFSLRDMADADLPGTLQMLQDIGYPEVELFQLHGRTALELRALLDEHSIRAIAAHVGIDRWRNELETVLDEAETLGMTYVGVPGIFPPPEPTVANWRGLASELNDYGEAAAERGLRFYYHNHDFEFVRSEGRVLYDILLEETDPDLVFFEMDLFWIVTGGRDPLDYLGRYDQSRWPLFHVKDRSAAPQPGGGNFADLGEGIINFARIFRELENKHYHHYLVERDTQANPRRTAQVGYQYLRRLTGRRRHKPYSPSEAGDEERGRAARTRT